MNISKATERSTGFRCTLMVHRRMQYSVLRSTFDDREAVHSFRLNFYVRRALYTVLRTMDGFTGTHVPCSVFFGKR